MDPEQAPYYMEAEINSPMVWLEPGASSALDTSWFPVRAGRELKAVTFAGGIERPLSASLSADGLHLSSLFCVFFPGTLTTHIFDTRGLESDVAPASVDPLSEIELNQTIPAISGAARVALHLNDGQGADLGSLGEAKITAVQKGS
jgi:hypothetical protein